MPEAPPLAGRLPARLLWLLLSASVVVLDQVTKAAVVARIPLHAQVAVIPGFFDLTHVQNTGAAFGLFASFDAAWKAAALNLVALAVFAGVLVFSLRSPAGLLRLQLALSLVLGGAVGNLVDRVRLGSVTDFLLFYVGRHQWPSFNVADSAITVGVALLAWDFWRNPAPEADPAPPVER
ncbi:MAG: signal peptidase II [Acidobacteria bacterium]|nr:MAG: signal peptidase II [Acidobacteriota bacterium]MCE7957658.1 signal peptidase II [Acidobacteria bacterium ACB2]